MKRTFTNLISALALLVFIAPSLVAWGQTATYSLTPDQSSTGSTATNYITTLTEFSYNSVSWKMNQWNPKTLQIKTNQSSAASEFRFYNTTAMPGRITQVVITFSALSVLDASKLMFKGGTSEVSGTSGGSAGTWNSTAKTLTWTPSSSDNFTYFAFYQNGKAASGTNYLASSDAIVVTYETGSTPPTLEESDFALTNAPIALSFDLYNNNAAQVINYSTSSTGTVSVATNDYVSATVDQQAKTITVTPVAVTNGNQTITVNQGADATYMAGSATFTVTITDSTPGVVFVAGTDQGSTSGNNSPDEMTKENVTISSTDAAFATSEYRMYSGSTTTVSVPTGYNITTIVFTGADTGKPISNLSVNGNNGSFEVDNNIGTWTGSSSSVAFGASAQARASRIQVIVEQDNTPIISANPSTLNTFSYLDTSTDPSAAQSVEVSGANLSTNITVTVGDNSAFEISTTENGTYTNTLTLTESNGAVAATNVFVRMKAQQTGTPSGTLALSSGTTSVNITLNGSVVTPMTVAQAITAIDNATGHNVSDAYVGGIISYVQYFSESNHYITYFISADGTRTDEIEVFHGMGLNGADFTAITDLGVGDQVIVHGDLTLYNSTTYEFAEGSELVSLIPHQAQPYTLEVTSVTNAEIEVFDATDPDDTKWVWLFEGEGNDQVTEGTPIALSVSAEQGYALTELMVNSVNHVADISGGLYSFNMPSQNVTITVTAVPVYNITYSKNGVETQTQVTSTTLTLPVGENLDSEFNFAGWTTTPGNFVTPIAAGTQVNIQGGETFYAVYSRTEGKEAYFEKVTEELQDWSGNYLIVAIGTYADNTDYSVAFNGSLETLDAAKNHIEVEIESGRIEYDESNAESVFTIAPIYNNNNEITGWSIKSASGYYIGRTANSNGMNTSTTDAYSHQIEIDNDGNADVTSSSSRVLRFNKNANDKRFRYYGSGGQEPIQLYKEVVVSLGTAHYYTRVFNEVASGDITISGPTIIPSGTVLDMGENSLTSGNADNLIIEDGGILIVHNIGVNATVKKEINGAGAENWAASSGADGWYFVASPVNIGFATATIGDYDLYVLDGNNEKWLNKKNNDNSGLFANGFQRGTGYLYASKDGNTLSLGGEIKPLINDTAKVVLHTTGWNLIGNPLTCKVTVDCAFDELNNASGVTSRAANSTINPCQGIAVYGDAGTTVTFTKAASQTATAPNNGPSIQMALSQNIVTRGNTSSATVDNAIISFNEGSVLPKFSMLEGNAKLFIPQGNEEYAIVSAEAQGEMPVCFKAKADGQYTISVDAENVEMSYLHLIDNITGADVDLLANPSYTFNAKGDDYASRFRLVFSANNNVSNAENGNFAFISNGQIILNGVSNDATIQVIDMLGRVVSSQTVNGNSAHMAPTASGVYVLRLIDGTNVMTQKIVVK